MKYKVISKKKLRVRAKPSLLGKVIGYLKPNTIVEIDKVGSKWSHRKNGGYVATKLIKKVVESPKPSTSPKPTPTISNAQRIADLAYELAYKTNDSKAKYPSGKPTSAYYKAFRKAFPEEERKKWKYKAHKDGANCGAFVGTVIRTLGIDKDFPHTSMASVKHLDDKTKFKRVSADNVKTGDIIVYKKGNDGHICIAHTGKVKEASYNQFYPKTTNSLKKRLDPTGKVWVRVYRAL